MKLPQWCFDFIRPFDRLFCFIVRPKTTGVKCLIQHDDQVLLIRNSYGKKRHWTFPGGGVHRGESPLQAVLREVTEEVGITIKDAQLLGSYFNTRQYKRDTVHCYLATVSTSDHTIDQREVAQSYWCHISTIPPDHSAAIDEVLKMIGKI